MAAEQGRAARRPFINTDVGDLLLYVFFFGAFVAGGAIGWIVRGLRADGAAPGVGGPGACRARRSGG